MSVFEQRQSLGSYEASNAFGATVTVSRERIREIALALSDEPSKVLQSLRDAQSLALPPRYKFRMPMAPSEARESDKDMRCLALFRPLPPYVLDYSESTTPTRVRPWDDSYQGTALFGQVEHLWVFNQHSGKIYVKFH